ncbi:MAG: hypothetical protein WDN69_35310 [Aliidongia sp.]
MPFTLQRSHFLETLYQRDRHVEQPDGRVSLADIAAHAALHRRDFTEIHGAALDRKLLLILADQFGATAGREDIQAEAVRFPAPPWPGRAGTAGGMVSAQTISNRWNSAG